MGHENLWQFLTDHTVEGWHGSILHHWAVTCILGDREHRSSHRKLLRKSHATAGSPAHCPLSSAVSLRLADTEPGDTPTMARAGQGRGASDTPAMSVAGSCSISGPTPGTGLDTSVRGPQGLASVCCSAAARGERSCRWWAGDCRTKHVLACVCALC